ncbi:LamG-like jellyroll fold domain-containing protein [Halobacteriaceae archaeon GCM10025711]
MYFFGLLLVLAMAYLVWATWAAFRRDRVEWFVPAVYGWVFFGLALAQVRFAGELAMFTALFGGLGFIHLSSVINLTWRPKLFQQEPKTSKGLLHDESTEDEIPTLSLPDTKTFGLYVALFLLVAGVGMAMTPLRTASLYHSQAQYETATWMDQYAEEQGWEYPQSYVFSEWDQNRLYNAFVSGESHSYGYARGNYQDFTRSKDGEGWYQKLSGRAGFVVTTDEGTTNIAQSLGSRLHNQYGSGTSHYRAVHVSEDGSTKVFTLVTGATITGTAPPNETVTVKTDVSIDGSSFTYTQDVKANPYSVYSATVPYAGTYSVGNASVEVSEQAVETGKQITLHERDGLVHWPFDAGNGKVAYDRVGGHRGTIDGAKWTSDAGAGKALTFGGKKGDSVQASVPNPEQYTVSLWFKPKELDTTEENDYRHLVATGKGSLLILEQNGRLSLRTPGVDSGRLVGGNANTGEWHHVVVAHNGTHRTIYLDGERVASGKDDGAAMDWGGRVSLGSNFGAKSHAFDGTIDEVRIWNRSLGTEDVKALDGQGS